MPESRPTKKNTGVRTPPTTFSLLLNPAGKKIYPQGTFKKTASQQPSKSHVKGADLKPVKELMDVTCPNLAGWVVAVFSTFTFGLSPQNLRG